jgi:hypothetical protein
MLSAICAHEKIFLSINFRDLIITKKGVEVFSIVYRVKLVFSKPQKYRSHQETTSVRIFTLAQTKKVNPNSFNCPENGNLAKIKFSILSLPPTSNYKSVKSQMKFNQTK